MRVSVLLPVYSETELLLRTIEQTRGSLGELLLEFVIVVSPKSTPECMELCQRLAKTNADIRTYVQSDRAGIGWAYREAIPHIRGTHGLILASDMETDPKDARRIAEKAIETGAEVVCASRWLPGGGFRGYDPFKLVLNYGYNLIFRMLYGISIHDITFGYKLIDAEVLRHTRWAYGRHEFCAELLLKPVRMGYQAAEVPTTWVKRPEGETKNTFMRNFKFASAAWKIRFAAPESFVEETKPAQVAA